MKCFYHSAKDAIGICKTCYKGLCGECAVDVGNGIACKGKCENEVKELNITISKGKKAYSRTGQAYARNAMLYLMMGLFFIIVGAIPLLIGKIEGIIPAGFGVIFLFGAFWNYSLSKKIDKQ